MHVVVDVDQGHLHQRLEVVEGLVCSLHTVVALVQKVGFAFEVQVQILNEPID